MAVEDELDQGAPPDPRWQQAARASVRLAACGDDAGVATELVADGRLIVGARNCGVTWDAASGPIPTDGPSTLVVAVETGDTPFGEYWLSGADAFTGADRELVVFLSASAAAALTALRDRAQLRAVEEAAGSQRERLLVASALEVARARETAASDGLRRAIAGQEAERARIARELHDESGQVLTAVALHLRALEGRETDDPYREQLANLRHAVVEAAQSLRRLITELRPPGLRDGGLAASIGDLAERLAVAGPRVEVSLESLPSDLPQEIEIAIYRVVQEALTNAARHSAAAHVGVMAGRDGRRLRIVIDDDGRGFRPDLPTSRLGLAGLRERVQLIGGELHVESTPGEGTSVTVDLDLDDA